jgi:hypothetical protein
MLGSFAPSGHGHGRNCHVRGKRAIPASRASPSPCLRRGSIRCFRCWRHCRCRCRDHCHCRCPGSRIAPEDLAASFPRSARMVSRSPENSHFRFHCRCHSHGHCRRRFRCRSQCRSHRPLSFRRHFRRCPAGCPGSGSRCRSSHCHGGRFHRSRARFRGLDARGPEWAGVLRWSSCHRHRGCRGCGHVLPSSPRRPDRPLSDRPRDRRAIRPRLHLRRRGLASPSLRHRAEPRPPRRPSATRVAEPENCPGRSARP